MFHKNDLISLKQFFITIINSNTELVLNTTSSYSLSKKQQKQVHRSTTDHTKTQPHSTVSHVQLNIGQFGRQGNVR